MAKYLVEYVRESDKLPRKILKQTMITNAQWFDVQGTWERNNPGTTVVNIARK